MGDAAVLFVVAVVAVLGLWLGVRRYNARLATSLVWKRQEIQSGTYYSVSCQRGNGPSRESQYIGEIPNDDPDFETKLYELRVVADLRASTLNGD